jgi:hypothetical protein
VKIIRPLFALCLCWLFLGGCEQPGQPDGVGTLSLNLVFPLQGDAVPPTLGMQRTVASSTFDSVRCLITRDGAEIVDQNLAHVGGTYQATFTLDVGPFYYVDLQAFLNGLVWYWGGQSFSIEKGVISQVNVIMVSSAPPAPANVSATAQSDSSVMVQWQDVVNEDGYRLEYRADTTERWDHVDCSPDSVHYLFTDLEPNTQYHFFIRAVNAGVLSDSTATVNAKTFPAPFTIVGSYPVTGAYDVALQGNYAYVTAGASGLHVIDVSDPAAPDELGSIAGTQGRPAQGITVAGNYAYIAWEDNGLWIVDITDPQNLDTVGTFPTSNCNDVAISGQYAYLASVLNFFQIVNIQDPSHPTLVGQTNAGYSANAELLKGDYTYLAEYSLSSLSVINIADPENPTGAYTLNNLNHPNDIAAYGDTLFLTTWNGVQSVDISNPANPVAGPFWSTGTSYATGITISGDALYIAKYSEGLWKLSASDPGNQSEWRFCPIPGGQAYHVAVQGNYTYVSAWDAGLVIIYVGP